MKLSASPLRQSSLALALAILFALPPRPSRAEDPSAAAQQRAIQLWKAGDFPAAIAVGEKLARDFPAEPRGRTAPFHIANYLENLATVECATLAEVRSALEDAKARYETAAKIPGQSKAAIIKSAEGAARLEINLRDLAAIERGELGYVEASARLADFEASRAAALYLKSRLDAGEEPADHLLFLILVRQASHADNMAARLRDAYEALRESDPPLFEFAYRKYHPALVQAAQEETALAERALAERPRSPYALDYRVYLGFGYQYSASAKFAERDWLLALKERRTREKPEKENDKEKETSNAKVAFESMNAEELAEAAAAALSEAVALLGKARAANIELLKIVNARIALSAPAIAHSPALPPSAVDLLRHRKAALDRLASLAASFSPLQSN